jgi:hypothetical protein
MSESSDTSPHITPLNNTNYQIWCMEARALLRKKGFWPLVHGDEPCPSQQTDPKDYKQWKKDASMAAGELFLIVDHDQRIHFQGIDDDPIAMWAKLESVHLHKHPSTCFNAYDDLFSIKKEEDETLQSLMNRVDQAILKIQALRPFSFTLQQSDEELAIMALIRALPDDYAALSTSLLLQPNLTKEVVQSAFKNEENQHRHRAQHSTESVLNIQSFIWP